MLYDRPAADLMVLAVKELSEPMTPGAIVAWFGQHYPNVQASTVRAHIIGLTVNNRSRRHYPSLARRTPLLYQDGRSRLLRFDPERHGDAVGGSNRGLDNVDEETIEEAVVSSPETMEFALEAYLEEFIITNWDLINWGRRLVIWEGDGERNGHQFTTPVGRLDFLAVDQDTETLVVIELKRGQTSDQVVGQVARYMGWLRERMAKTGQAVEGIVVAGDIDERLYYAATAVPGLTVQEYHVSFSLAPPGELIR